MKRGKYESVNEQTISDTKEKNGFVVKDIWNSLLLYLHDLVYLLTIALVILLLCFRVVVVSGSSMNSTLLDGDYLFLLSNTFYREAEPGDIIVISKDSFDNGKPIVKRVIAVENQWVDIDFESGIVSVNGKALQEPYTLTPTNYEEGMDFPLLVEEGCVFVLGDNRNKSIDSRSEEIGLVDCREIIGKAIFLFFPGTNKEMVPRDFSRIGVLSHAGR